MADTDERLERANQLLRNAQGFMSDAEFREDAEVKQVRYLQAISAAMVSLALQNQVILDVLKKQGEYGDLAEA